MEVADFKEFEGFRLDTAGRELWYGEDRVPLSPKEAEILCLLASRPGRLVTKEEIFEAVWPESYVEESNLSRQVYMLRKRLRELGARTDLIENVPRRGYRFNAVTLSETRQDEKPAREGEPAPIAAMPRADIHRRVYFSGAVALCFAVLAGIAFATWQFNSPVQPRSVAVLPFNVVGGNQDDARAGVAVADLLITRLSGVKQLTVRPTSAVMGFDGSTSSVEFGKRIAVDTVIEGTVLATSEGRRVTVRMLSVPEGDAIWSGEFTVAEGRLLSVHDEIAARLTDTVFHGRGPGQTAAARNRLSANDAAVQLYAEARYHWNNRNKEGISRAAFLFQKAADADPNFTLAKVGLAEATMMGYDLGLAENMLRDAATADPDLSEIYSARGFIALFHVRDGRDAEANFKRAIALNPNNGSAHQWYATLLAVQGRFDEAKASMARALEIDPLSANYVADLAQIHYFAGEFDEAEKYAGRALELRSNFTVPYHLLADTAVQRGDMERWIEYHSLGHAALSDSNPERIAELAEERRSLIRDRLARGGPSAVDDLMLEDTLADNNPNKFIGRARILTRRGETAAAVADLQKALESRAFLLPFVKVDPAFAPLANDPGFNDVVNRIGF